MSKHKSYDAELKLQVVLEVFKGEKTLAQICREHEVAADLVCNWRDVFLIWLLSTRAERKKQRC